MHKWSGSWVWLTPDEINALHDHLAQSTDFESLPLPPLQSVITKLTDATSDATRALAAAAEEDMPDIATLDPDMRGKLYRPAYHSLRYRCSSSTNLRSQRAGTRP